MRQDLGKRFANQLFDALAAANDFDQLATTRRASRSYWIASILAALIHSAGLLLAVAGVAVLASAGWNLFQVVFGLILLMLAWIARPRLAPIPDYVLDQNEYPVLHSITRRLAATLNAPPVADIEASADFGASYRSAGWRQERYISLGAPLMAILTREERLAVIAHELSHGANGDPMRGLFLFGAVDTLSNWAEGMRPTSVGHSADSMPLGPIVSILAIPFDLALLALSEMLFAAARGMVLLVLRDSQRAEYLADLLAASAVGTQAMIDGLEKTYLEAEVQAASRRHALTRPDEPLQTELVGEVASVNDAAMQAHRDRSKAELWQVDSTHPPTALRVAMLRTLPAQFSALAISDEEGRMLDEEVSRLIQWRQREVVNRNLAAIYG